MVQLCTETEILGAAEEMDLPILTPKQLAYVLGICAGKSAYEAYCDAFDTAGGSTAQVDSWKLRQNPKIIKWLDRATELALNAGGTSRDEHLAELARLRNLAAAQGQHSAAIQAEKHRGTVAGHYVEQTRDLTDRDDSAIVERARALFSPEIVEKILQGK